MHWHVCLCQLVDSHCSKKITKFIHWASISHLRKKRGYVWLVSHLSLHIWVQVTRVSCKLIFLAFGSSESVISLQFFHSQQPIGGNQRFLLCAYKSIQKVVLGMFFRVQKSSWDCLSENWLPYGALVDIIQIPECINT